MPTTDQMLAGLGEIAKSWRWLAVGWHVYLAVLVIGLVAGARPSRRVAGALVSLPLLSVSVMAWWAGNPFNGTFLGLVGVAAIVISGRLGGSAVTVAGPGRLVSGAVMLVFGWVYPHFLESSPVWAYAYAAPTGLIPCPTLSAVIGLGLLLRGLESRGWSLLIGVTGLFYGVFGAVRLGVSLDWVLVVGALILMQGVVGRRVRSI